MEKMQIHGILFNDFKLGHKTETAWNIKFSFVQKLISEDIVQY